jgi:hypothetical protein
MAVFQGSAIFSRSESPKSSWAQNGKGIAMKPIYILPAALFAATLFVASAAAQEFPQPGFGGQSKTQVYPAAGPGMTPIPGYLGSPQQGIPTPKVDPELNSKRYGLHPFFGKVFGRIGGGCNTCGKKGKEPPPPPIPLPPLASGGTLVFPNWQFVRSPRDFFMYGERGPAWGE